MVEFKQIIGRGTRLFEGKDYFNIIDFVGATNNFYDEAWDGEPAAPVKKSKLNLDSEDEGVGEQETVLEDLESKDYQEKEFQETEKEGTSTEKVEVQLGTGRTVKVINIEERFVDENGKPLSAEDFLQKIVGKLPEYYQDIDKLREAWADPENRDVLLQKLYDM